MNHKDTKKIFANWKHNITNRLDEMFVSKLSEKSQDEDDAKDEKDDKVLLGEEEPEELEEISPIPTPIPREGDEFAEDKKDDKVLLGEEEPEELKEEELATGPIKDISIGREDDPWDKWDPKTNPEGGATLDVKYDLDPQGEEIPSTRKVVGPGQPAVRGMPLSKKYQTGVAVSEGESKENLEETVRAKIREAIQKVLNEKTKTDSPDRAPSGHPEDRLKPLEEEEKEKAEDIGQALEESLERINIRDRFKKLID
tara:strand:- start:380 stop:1144 length:765 start_codon:yes stop_codon:yes gene_type:complete